MRKIILSAGHATTQYNTLVNPPVKLVNQPDRGVAVKGNVSEREEYIEGDLAAEFRQLIVDELKALGVIAVVDANKNVLRDSLKVFKNLITGKDIAIDIHFNAGSILATGCEVLIPSNPSAFEIKAATGINAIISTTLGIKNRGNKTEADSHHATLGWLRQLNCENFIVEICFLTNINDRTSYLEKRSILAKNLANYLITLINI